MLHHLSISSFRGVTMKNKNIKNIISCLCFTLILILLISCMNYVLRNKNEADLIYPYYSEKENSLDVVFVGSSHVMCGVFPMDLWNDYGIASYDFTSSALVLPQAYYQVIEALKTQSPEVLVIDVSGVVYKDAKVGTEEYVHVQLDNMKWSLNRINAINDLIEDPTARLEYYMPFVKFHSRWKELAPYDYSPIVGNSKGARITYGTLEVDDEYQILPEDHIVPMHECPETYLRKILDYCAEKDQKVLLLNTPVIASNERQGNYNAVYELAKEYHVPYLNLMHEIEDMNFDFENDMRDEAHCNVNGGVKVTNFIGEYLKSNYELPDRRIDPEYNDWHTFYKAYITTYNY